MANNNNKPLIGKVCLVTGATRGIGKGIAIQLGQAGAIVYITGRTLNACKDGSGSLEETANEIKERGGLCVPVQCDHENDTQITNLFHKIEMEQNGQLDILVNNAFKGVPEMEPEVWDDLNNVGLRNHYICAVYAARLMIPRKQGLIVNVSSYGGQRYFFNAPYGIGKVGVDRMANDCGIELKPHNVAMISLYPGSVKTELIQHYSTTHDLVEHLQKIGIKWERMLDLSESPEFSGKVVVALAQDSNIMKYTTKCVIAAEYAQSHGIVDIDNKVKYSMRQFKYLFDLVLPDYLRFISYLMPAFMKIPKFLLDILNSKY